jgi:hypothetical protein
MLISLLRGVGLIFIYLLPFTPKAAYRYTPTNKGIRGDWERMGAELQAALQKSNELTNKKERHHEAAKTL